MPDSPPPDAAEARTTPPPLPLEHLPSLAEFERRKAFIGFSAADVAMLQRLHPILSRIAPDFINTFYEHLDDYRGAVPKLSPDTVERLKAVQAGYFDTLTQGCYDERYLKDRLVIGNTHARVGLPPGWYIGGYCHYLTEMLPALYRTLSAQGEDIQAALQALLRIALLDMGLAIDAYIAQRDQRIAQLNDYRSVFDKLPFAILVTTDALQIRYANTAFGRLFELSPDSVLDRSLHEVLYAPGLEAQVTSRNRPDALRKLFLRPHDAPQSSAIPVSLSQLPLHGASGQGDDRQLLLFEDLRLRSQLELDLINVQAAAGIGHWHADLSTGHLHCSIEACHLFCLPDTLPVTLPALLDNVHEEDKENAQAAWQAALSGTPLRIEHRLANTDTLRWVEVRGQFQRDEITGNILTGIGTVYDITSRKIAQNQIQQLAYFDTLTGLPNRVSALEQLRQATMPGKQGPSALLFLDIDHFKDVNDSQGHATGDQVLMKVVLRLASVLRQNEPLARLGGDEFIIVLEDADEQAAALVSQRLIRAMREPVRCAGMTFSLGLSIGIARFPEDGRNAQDLLRQADTAMYQAKRQGGNAYKFYHPDMSASLQRQLEMQVRLDAALRGGTMQMHYQPVIDLARPGHPTVGAEALMRWNDDAWGWVSPAEFIPVAESRGLIQALGEWGLTHVSRQVRRWKDEGLSLPGRIAVNVSAREMEDADFVDRAIRLVREAGASPSDLELELTERSLIKEPQQAREMALALTDAGFRLALDDFGTGYSSLAQLRHFPVQKLKIDMSFVSDMLTNTGDQAIVRSIISMAEALQLKTVAEGVEQPAQADALRSLGCNLAQGNCFSPGLPPQAFARWWLRQSAR